MISEKYYRFFFLTFVYFFSFDVFVSNSFAAKINPTCEITNTNINCVNILSSEIINIKLFNDPYRMQIKFRNKLKIKKKYN